MMKHLCASVLAYNLFLHKEIKWHSSILKHFKYSCLSLMLHCLWLISFRFTGPDGPSGFGFELTFRLKRETGESAPPTWPAELMQGLARYVFQSGID